MEYVEPIDFDSLVYCEIRCEWDGTESLPVAIFAELDPTWEED